MTTEPEGRWSDDTVALRETQGAEEEQAERLRYVVPRKRRLGPAPRRLALGALICAAATTVGIALAASDDGEPTRTAGSVQLGAGLEARFEKARERERLIAQRKRTERRAARRARRRAAAQRKIRSARASAPTPTATAAVAPSADPVPASAPEPEPAAPPPPEPAPAPAPKPQPAPAPPPVQREFGIEH